MNGNKAFPQRRDLNWHVESVHKQKSSSNAKFVTKVFLKKDVWINILTQLIKEKKLFKCDICDKVFLGVDIWRCRLIQFMKKKIKINVIIVMQIFFLNGNLKKHIEIQWQVSEHCTGILAYEIVVEMIKTKGPQIILQRNRFSSQRRRLSLSDSDRKNPTDFRSKETEERSWFHLKSWQGNSQRNPWEECDFYTKEEHLLKNHVTENHPCDDTLLNCMQMPYHIYHNDIF